MNTKPTADLVAQNRVVAMTADTTDGFSPEMEALYAQMGVQEQVVPVLGVFPAGDRPPIVLKGPLSEQDVLDALQKAGPSTGADGGS